MMCCRLVGKWYEVLRMVGDLLFSFSVMGVRLVVVSCVIWCLIWVDLVKNR